MDEFDRRLEPLGLVVPRRPEPIALFLPYQRSGSLVFLAGQTCERDGKMLYTGRVGEEVDFETARRAAVVCALNLVAALREACHGRFELVSRCLRVGGFVQASSGFARVPHVIDAASEVFVALFGERGKHARTAIGVSTLPQNAAVEVDAIFELTGAP